MATPIKAVTNPEFIVGDVVLYKLPRGRQNKKYGQGIILDAGFYPHLMWCGGWTYNVFNSEAEHGKTHLYGNEIIKKLSEDQRSLNTKSLDKVIKLLEDKKNQIKSK